MLFEVYVMMYRKHYTEYNIRIEGRPPLSRYPYASSVSSSSTGLLRFIGSIYQVLCHSSLSFRIFLDLQVLLALIPFFFLPPGCFALKAQILGIKFIFVIDCAELFMLKMCCTWTVTMGLN